MINEETSLFRKILLATIIVLIVFVAILGISYASSNSLGYSKNTSFSTYNLKTVYDNNYKISINSNNDFTNKSSLEYLSFSVFNEDSINYDLFCRANSDTHDVKIFITKEVDGKEIPVTDVIVLSSLEKNTDGLYHVYSDSDTIATYRVRYWSNSESDNNLLLDFFAR